MRVIGTILLVALGLGFLFASVLALCACSCSHVGRPPSTYGGDFACSAEAMTSGGCSAGGVGRRSASSAPAGLNSRAGRQGRRLSMSC